MAEHLPGDPFIKSETGIRGGPSFYPPPPRACVKAIWGYSPWHPEVRASPAPSLLRRPIRLRPCQEAAPEARASASPRITHSASNVARGLRQRAQRAACAVGLGYGSQGRGLPRPGGCASCSCDILAARPRAHYAYWFVALPFIPPSPQDLGPRTIPGECAAGLGWLGAAWLACFNTMSSISAGLKATSQAHDPNPACPFTACVHSDSAERFTRS